MTESTSPIDSKIIELIQLSIDNKPFEKNTLEFLCINKILDYCINLSTYGPIDFIYYNRVGPFILSYQLIKNLCQLMETQHLLDKFLIIYGDKLKQHFSVIDVNDNSHDTCSICKNKIIIDDCVYNSYIGICKNNHKIIWTDGYIEDKEFTKIQVEHKCINCELNYEIMKTLII